MYELEFVQARSQIEAYEHAHPEDPVGAAAEAATYLFEEFNEKGVLTSDFFLDDSRLLGGISGTPDTKLSSAFLAANRRARALAVNRMNANPLDPDALLAMTLEDGMEGDYQALIEKQQLASLGPIHRAEEEARKLLQIEPNMGDAYVAIGAGNYIIGCLPAYKRMFLWFGGIHGSRQRGVEQLQIAATQGHYLQVLAKLMLALACEREHQADRALGLFQELDRDFPNNPVFARELARLQARGISKASCPAQSSVAYTLNEQRGIAASQQ